MQTAGMGARAPLAWEIVPERSLRLAGVLVAAHAAAAAAVLVSAVPIAVRVALCLLIALSAVRAVRLHALRSSRSAVRGLRMAGDGACEIEFVDRRTAAARLLASTVTGPYLTVIRLKLTDSRWPVSMLLLPVNCDHDALRRLRVGLLWRVRPTLAHSSVIGLN